MWRWENDNWHITLDARMWTLGYIQWNGPSACYRAVRLGFGPLLLEWSE